MPVATSPATSSVKTSCCGSITRDCHHERDVNPATVHLRADTSVLEIGNRLKCSNCGSRNIMTAPELYPRAGISISPKTGMGKILCGEYLRGLGFAGQRRGRFPMSRWVLEGTWPHEGSRRIQWGCANALSAPWADTSAWLQRPSVIGSSQRRCGSQPPQNRGEGAEPPPGGRKRYVPWSRHSSAPSHCRLGRGRPPTANGNLLCVKRRAT